jgi:type III pantothenate kinase
MMLLLDIGNSRLKWAIWDGHALADSTALEHGGDPAAAIAACRK